MSPCWQAWWWRCSWWHSSPQSARRKDGRLWQRPSPARSLGCGGTRRRSCWDISAASPSNLTSRGYSWTTRGRCGAPAGRLSEGKPGHAAIPGWLEGRPGTSSRKPSGTASSPNKMLSGGWTNRPSPAWGVVGVRAFVGRGSSAILSCCISLFHVELTSWAILVVRFFVLLNNYTKVYNKSW